MTENTTLLSIIIHYFLVLVSCFTLLEFQRCLGEIYPRNLSRIPSRKNTLGLQLDSRAVFVVARRY